MQITVSTHILICSVLSAFLLGCADEGGMDSSNSNRHVPEIMRPTLSFYQIPRCFLCQELSSTLSELEKEHGPVMNFRTVDYHLPASQERLHKSQVGSHGIIISDPEGQELWHLKAHAQGKDELTAAVERIAAP